jgi:hypothetical protein
MMQSVWYVVDAIDAHPDLKISYPAGREEQHAIAASFQKKSGASFPSCAGAIDGILVWIHKPRRDAALASSFVDANTRLV